MLWLCKTKIWWKHFVVYIKTDDIYKGIAKDVETLLDTSNYEWNRPLRKKIKKIIGLMKDELGGKTLKKLVGLRGKVHG